MSLLNHPPVYKPFGYPWAYEAWLEQQRNHWLPEEVPMTEDVIDWKTKLNDRERNLITQILRFFTQSDIEVNGVYQKYYANTFKPTEILMMIGAFANIETVHIAAYSHLIDTLGLPESEYSAFLKYQEMKEKYEHWQEFNMDSPKEIAKTLAVFGGFTEGLQLFASFAMLMNFQRFNKMRGIGQIVGWSVRDESLHCVNIIKLFHAFCEENRKDIDMAELHSELKEHLVRIMENEDAFIDLAFEAGDVEGLSAEDVKRYIRYMANRRCNQLGLDVLYPEVSVNPLPWMDENLSSHDHSDFFSTKVNEYSKAGTSGDWGDVSFG